MFTKIEMNDIHRGMFLVVRLNNGQELDGMLFTCNSKWIVLSKNGQVQDACKKEDVKEIYLLSRGVDTDGDK